MKTFRMALAVLSFFVLPILPLAQSSVELKSFLPGSSEFPNLQNARTLVNSNPKSANWIATRKDGLQVRLSLSKGSSHKAAAKEVDAAFRFTSSRYDLIHPDVPSKTIGDKSWTTSSPLGVGRGSCQLTAIRETYIIRVDIDYTGIDTLNFLDIQFAQDFARSVVKKIDKRTKH